MGMTTVRNARRGEEPKVRAASTTSGASCDSDGYSVMTVKGKIPYTRLAHTAPLLGVSDSGRLRIPNRTSSPAKPPCFDSMSCQENAFNTSDKERLTSRNTNHTT